MPLLFVVFHHDLVLFYLVQQVTEHHFLFQQNVVVVRLCTLDAQSGGCAALPDSFGEQGDLHAQLITRIQLPVAEQLCIYAAQKNRCFLGFFGVNMRLGQDDFLAVNIGKWRRCDPCGIGQTKTGRFKRIHNGGNSTRQAQQLSEGFAVELRFVAKGSELKMYPRRAFRSNLLFEQTALPYPVTHIGNTRKGAVHTVQPNQQAAFALQVTQMPGTHPHLTHPLGFGKIQFCSGDIGLARIHAALRAHPTSGRECLRNSERRGAKVPDPDRPQYCGRVR